MASIKELEEIFSRITEEYEEPVPIGGRCESRIFYRVGDLSDADLDACAEYVAERIKNVVSPSKPQLFLKLPGGYSFFAERLCAVYSELYNKGKDVPLEQYLESKMSNGHGEKYKGHSAILVTDVITTARSSLEAHTRATLKGMRDIMADPKAASLAYVQAVPVHKGKEASIQQMFEMYNKYVYAKQAQPGVMDETRLADLQKFYVSNGVVPTAVPLKDLYTNQFVLAK